MDEQINKSKKDRAVEVYKQYKKKQKEEKEFLIQLKNVVENIIQNLEKK
jgi:hypothetical protein